MDPQLIVDHISSAAASQVAQYGFFFTLAAWLHAGRVKKEIGTQFTIITEAINNVAQALKSDLATHEARIERIENVVFKPTTEERR